jgi:hypothetical protein
VRRILRLRLAFLAAVALAAAAAPASALSEIGPDSSRTTGEAAGGDGGVPIPGTGSEAGAREADGENEPLPAILTDPALLPEPVRRMREQMIEACRSGDIEALRGLIATGDDATQLSFGGVEGDPIDYLREISGDGEGHEILAILAEVLEAGFVHLDAGTPQEIYVWPYFFAYPLERLDGRQRVELFRLVTALDYEDMLSFGGYNFFRVGITPAGHWAFFVAGD